jgi:hypothetical protein
MKKSIIGLLLAGFSVVLVLGSLNVWAGEERPVASADVDVLNKYVWRGYELSNDSVVIQPSATIGYKGFALNMWGNLDTDDDRDGENNLNETDLTLSYEKKLGAASMEIGYIYYGLDNADDNEEIYIRLSYDTLLAPTVTIYREFAHAASSYITLGISHSKKLKGNISLDCGGSLGYLYSDDEDELPEFDADGLIAKPEKYRNFHDGLVYVGLMIPVCNYVSVNPILSYSFPLSGDADDHIKGMNRGGGFTDDADYLFGGVKISLAF